MGEKTPLDAHGQPLARHYAKARLTDRAIDELIGLCKGVIADGVVTTEEVKFLLKWMELNRQAANEWPANILYRRAKEVLADGVVDSNEEAELVAILMDITGGGLSHDPAAGSMSSSLPFTEPAPNLEFTDRVFCFTGKFVFGPRKECEQIVADLGGSSTPSPTRKTDYLVVGAVGSSDWIHSTHGRKVERAIEMRERGQSIAVVSEQHWTEAVTA